MLKLRPFVDKFADAVSMVSFAGLLFIAGISVADVVMQRVFNNPIVGTYELVERAMLCAVFCAFAYGQTQKSHICMTLIISKLPRPACMTIFSLVNWLGAAMAVILTYAAGYQAGASYADGTVTGMLHIPLYPFYIVETIAMAAFVLVFLYDTILSTVAIFRDDYAELVRSSWS